MEPASLKKELKAHAKINLFLSVGKTDERGYHLLNTVFQPLHLADKIIIEERMSKGVVLTSNQDIPLGEKNSAYKAVGLVCRKADKTIENARLKIHIEKHIPLSSGLGGSAVDAAPVIRELNSRWNVGLADSEMEAIASAIGADVPQALYNQTTYAERYGDLIKTKYSLPKRYVCIYIPNEYMSSCRQKTAALYKLIDGQEKDFKQVVPMLTAIWNKNWKEIGTLMHNDFETVAFREYPLLRKVKELYLENSAEGALLAGSGGAVFGIFRTPEESFRASNVIASSIARSRFGQIILTETA